MYFTYLLFNYLSFPSKFKFKKVNKIFNQLQIEHFYDKNLKIYTKLNQQILSNHKHIKSLFLSNNINHFNLNLFVNLRKLNLYGSSFIQSEFFTNISSLTKLRKFTASYYNNDLDMQNLDLIKLDLSFNNFIKQIYHFTNIKKLILRMNRSIKNEQLSFLSPYVLDISFTELNNITHMTRLKKLNIAKNYSVANSYLQNLKLKELIITNCSQITNIGHMTSLKKLKANYLCGINNDSLKNLDLTLLDIDYNSNITTITYLTNLQKLRISSTHINCNQLSSKLIKLSFSENDNIKNINHLTNLIHLEINSTLINNSQISNLTKIQFLSIWDNYMINNLSHMNNLSRLCLNHCRKDEIILPDKKINFLHLC